MNLGIGPGWRSALHEITSLRQWGRALGEPPGDDFELPPGNGQPVLLIPGLFASDRSLAHLACWFESYGYRVIDTGINVHIGCPQQTSDRLGRRLRRLRQPAIVIGHSKGGLVAYSLACRYPTRVSRLITLGSPLVDPFRVASGTRLAVTAVRSFQQAAGLQGPHPHCYTIRCGCPTARVFQSMERPPMPFTSIYSRSDGVIDWLSCLHPGADCVEVRCSHVAMPVNKAVFAAIARSLEAPAAVLGLPA